MLVKDKMAQSSADYNGWTSEQKSLTLPNQDLNIGDAVERLHLGRDVKTYAPYYSSDLGYEVPDFALMSTLEKLQWSAENRDEIERLQKVAIGIQEAASKADIKPVPKKKQANSASKDSDDPAETT